MQTHGPERAATFREVFGQSEYRAVFTASALSWLGDYIAKAAVTVLVFQRTDSVALSAAAFAVSYLPWLVGGPLLATLAERNSYRTVMIFCDVLRMVLIALVAIPGVPIWLILTLLFATTLGNPPSQAAKSALMPLILPGDRLVLGLSVNASTGQAAQVIGYLLGAAIAAVNPKYALLIDAVTFGASALVIWFGVRHRSPVRADGPRRHLLRETGEGFRIVFGSPVLRAIAILAFAAMLFATVPEGLAAGWAAESSRTDAGRGFAQGIIMASNPVGFIVGSLVVGRLVRPALRRALIRPFAVLAPLFLVPALLNPPPVVVAALAAGCGFAVAGIVPTANGLFVQALPNGYRARAFGVMGTGVQVMQGGAVLVTGLVADRFTVPRVVGLWSLAGVGLMLLVILVWPTERRIDAAIGAASRAETATAGPSPAGDAEGSGTVPESPAAEPARPPAQGIGRSTGATAPGRPHR